MARPLFLIPLLALGLGLHAQAPKAPATKTPEKPSVATPVASPSAAEAASQAELTQIKQIPYRAALIRDPFSAPTDVEQANKGDLVDDIGVKGWLKSGGISYAVVSDSRGNTKKLPIGYKFRDGEIVAIDEKSVTFHQWDISSTNRSVYRTVVKTFKREEGKR